ncbi:hypothetical protein [Streptomyces violaceusniger]|uniref:hypothetical protein n=1 Tax=Streptomyces violaceusniger TaxID=68280 RepID=UPI0005BB4A28|nr:hypothetical protein [Streptomyces violaceusniger]
MGGTLVHRYVLVVDRGDPRRLTGLVVAAVYNEPGEDIRRLGVFHLEEPPGDLPGRAMGARIAELVEAMDPMVPVHVMCGVTLDGKAFARKIIMPAVFEGLRAAVPPREVTWETYAAHVRGAVKEVGRKVSLSERVSALSVALELRTVMVPRSVAMAESVLRALKNYDPTNAIVEDGTDKWNAVEHEGIITAIAAAHTTLGEASLYAPRGDRAHARLEDPRRSPTSFVGHPTIAVPEAYVEGGIGQKISGTVTGGFGGNIGGRWPS